MSELRGLLHVHTWHSFDSLLPPAAYLAYARRSRLDFLCVTDHNTLAGSLEVARRNTDPRLEVVIGAEYATDRGDLIGLFLREEVRSRRFADAAAEIHAQGGLALLPHPYRGRVTDPSRYETVDLIEVFNARSSDASNAAARADAERLKKPVTAGADIHTAWELVRDGTLVELCGEGPLRERLLVAPRQLATRPSHRNLRRYSQLVKRVRSRAGFDGHR
ncbi:MAG: PHP domain-containing protein [Chloroflexota bacterium]|nr:PHP domain-containing protein [Chloroflexota bacterium]